MNGLELLREEMKTRGCNTAQYNSKTVAIVLDILSGEGIHAFTDIYQAEQDLKAIQEEIERRKRDWSRFWDRFQKRREESEAEIERQLDYIKGFNDAMIDAETPEARDAMRTAQVFINSVKVDSKYDNTAFINGLAAILSRGGIGALNRLQKLDPDAIKSNMTIV